MGHTAKGRRQSCPAVSAWHLTWRANEPSDGLQFCLAAASPASHIEIQLRNRKDDEAVAIIVPERLYRWRDWQIIESSAPFVKVDNASIEFDIAVAPAAEEVLTYTVQYSFPEEDE